MLALPGLAAPSGAGEMSPRLLKLIERSNGVYSVAEAAAAGDTDVLKARLAEGADPNEVDEEGNCPLHHAAGGKSDLALNLLLKAGADPLATNAEGKTPRQICRHEALSSCLQTAEKARERELALCKLITRADVTGVRAALAEGVNPNARSADRVGSLLLYAVSLGHASVVRALLEAGAEVDAITTRGGRTSLHIAASNGDMAVLRELMAAKPNPLLPSANGAYPLHDAVWNRRLEAVRLLLPAYAHINFNPRGGPHGSPLAMAIHYGRTDIVRAFLEAGFNPNDARLAGDPPLIQAVRSGHADCVKLFLEAGADKQMKDAHGKMAADYAQGDLLSLLH